MREALRARPRRCTPTRSIAAARIGEHGAELLRAGAQVLTHCNAGALATGGYGTALGVIRAAHRRDPSLHVWVDETRPLLQGARLTAWELRAGGHLRHADHRLGRRLADGAGQGRRRRSPAPTASPRNGDAANKIGTYGAERARPRARHAVLRRGADLDDRPCDRDRRGHPDRAPRAGEVSGGRRPQGFGVYNPAFDVTPAANISAIITEHGVRRPPYPF